MALRRVRGLQRHPWSAGQCAYEHMSQTEMTFPQMTSQDCTTASHTQDHRRCHCFHGIDPQPAASGAQLFRFTWLHVCMPLWPRWERSVRPCRVKLLQLDNKQANWSLFLASGDREKAAEETHPGGGERGLETLAHSSSNVGSHGDLSLSFTHTRKAQKQREWSVLSLFLTSHCFPNSYTRTLGSLVHSHTFTGSLGKRDLGLCSQEAHVLKPALSRRGWVTLKCKASCGGSRSSWCVVPVKYAALEWITTYHPL